MPAAEQMQGGARVLQHRLHIKYEPNITRELISISVYYTYDMYMYSITNSNM